MEQCGVGVDQLHRKWDTTHLLFLFLLSISDNPPPLDVAKDHHLNTYFHNIYIYIYMLLSLARFPPTGVHTVQANG